MSIFNGLKIFSRFLSLGAYILGIFCQNQDPNLTPRLRIVLDAWSRSRHWSQGLHHWKKERNCQILVQQFPKFHIWRCGLAWAGTVTKSNKDWKQ